MKTVSRLLCIASLFLIISFSGYAQTKKKPVKKTPAQKTTIQKTTTQKKPEQKPAVVKSAATPATVGVSSEPVKDDKKVRDIVAFFQYMLNMLASGSTSARDKDVLIRESYTKIFNDEKVQIEDDLDNQRETVTNKEVMAYLKDVDFFFTDAKFEFTIENIEQGTNAKGGLFYKVSATRNLRGTTSDGQSVNSNAPRFIEINYKPEEQDLKIVSIYTHEVDERAALTNWWKGLSFEWQALFKKRFGIMDSVSLTNLKDITSIDSLDLSNNTFIKDLAPLSRLVNLKSLNISHSSISDLTPIRNLTELTRVNLSYAPVQDISALKYAGKIQYLSLQHTAVTDISILSQMTHLRQVELNFTPVTDFSVLTSLPELITLDLTHTRITDLSALQGLVQLQELSLGNTSVRDLNSLKGLKNMTVLNVDSSGVSDISALSNAEHLKILHANYTLITDLSPLLKLGNLEKVYVDHTAVKKAGADSFMKSNPQVLVIYNSGDLINWWSALSPAWQDVLTKLRKTSSSPSKEELASMTSIDSINVSGNAAVNDLEALRPLLGVRVVIASRTSIRDLTPLRDHMGIMYLDISETDVSDLSVTRQFTKLKELRADKSKIESLEPLTKISSLKKLYVDETAIHDIPAQEFLEKNPDCLIVYKTIHLNRWWKSLSPEWKKVIYKQLGKDTLSSRENLHKVVELETFHIENAPIHDLSGLTEFVRLKELYFSGTSITEIPALANIASLKILHATNGPLEKIDALSQLNMLEELNISNTPVNDLKIVGMIPHLNSLNCSGTQIKRLNALESLTGLAFLDCSNTFVGQLDPVSYHTLKTLKCYNTKVSAREVELFKKSNPECEVVYYR